jgi:hypothetical protein
MKEWGKKSDSGSPIQICLEKMDASTGDACISGKVKLYPNCDVA